MNFQEPKVELLESESSTVYLYALFRMFMQVCFVDFLCLIHTRPDGFRSLSWWIRKKADGSRRRVIRLLYIYNNV